MKQKFLIRGCIEETIKGGIILCVLSFLINLIPFLWLRMLSYTIFVVAMILCMVYTLKESEDVVEFKDDGCLNKAFDIPCPIKGDYIKERCDEATPVKMEDLEQPPKGFKFGDF